jgi:hypothetical protein
MSRGLNTDSWRPLWGYRHDHQANSKDLVCKINPPQRLLADSINSPHQSA